MLLWISFIKENLNSDPYLSLSKISNSWSPGRTKKEIYWHYDLLGTDLLRSLYNVMLINTFCREKKWKYLQMDLSKRVGSPGKWRDPQYTCLQLREPLQHPPGVTEGHRHFWGTSHLIPNETSKISQTNSVVKCPLLSTERNGAQAHQLGCVHYVRYLTMVPRTLVFKQLESISESQGSFCGSTE